jgi:NhaC family Na+:H+ antiporter
MSPLSDTTNLAPGISGTDLFIHIKFMWRSTIPAYIICLVIFFVLGFRYSGSDAVMGYIAVFTEGLLESFNINPVFLLPPMLVIVCIAFKIPAIPGIFVGVLSGTLIGILQGNNFGVVLDSAMYGFHADTGIEALDDLLSAGGLNNMMWTIGLVLLANAFGGIMEKSGQLAVLVQSLLKFAEGTTSLVTTTILTCFGSNILIPDQYIAIIVPGRMYSAEYRRRKLHPKMLSNCLDASGTITSALVPWNTCGVFMASILGVSTIQYAPYALFNWLMPLTVIVMTAIGRLTVKIEDDPGTVIKDIP